MQDLFDQPLAIDPQGNGGAGTIVADAVFQVFAEDDLTFSNPLPVYEPGEGGALIPQLKTSSIGQLPQFRVAGDPATVVLRSGAYAVRVNSLLGVARQALEEAGAFAAEIEVVPSEMTAAIAEKTDLFINGKHRLDGGMRDVV